MEFDVMVEADGTIRFVYSDDLAEAFEGESQETRRASLVEPFNGPAGPGWTADMSPSGGPVLFDREGSRGRILARPFRTRAEALAAERNWLRQECGL